jgi:hypothetical protein
MSKEHIKEPIYIAGRMSGLPEFNYPAFFAMENKLRDLGIQDILNPVYIADGELGHPYGFYIRHSLKLLIQAQSIVMLNGWKGSKGAELEYHTAKTMGIPIFNQDLELITEEDEDTINIFEEAQRLILGARQTQYGSPKQNFTAIGRIWGALLNIPDIAPETVAIMMAGLKLARQSNTHKTDNLVDCLGYVGTIPLIRADTETY